MVAALFKRTAAFAVDHCNRIVLRVIHTKEFISHAVKTVRFKIRSKILISIRFIEQIFLDDSVFVRASCAIKTHLEVLIINVDGMERKFQIREKA